MNTGGPLIAGVLGTDEPTFYTIGGPINVASRLHSIGLPGQIQVSQETHDLIADICRGEVILKGKGRSMVYVITSSKACLTNNGTSSDLFSC